MYEQVFYIPIERKDKLCCITCDVDSDEVDNSVAKSFFHWQTLKCRFIVNLMQDDVIGSPIPGTDRSFYIITTKDFYQDGTLKTIFERLNLTTSAPLEVTAKTYITCIRYTFQFVIAPSWNRVSNQLYVKGRNFLSNDETHAAIKMNLNLVTNSRADDDEISIKLSSFNVILYPLKLQDLGLPQSIIVDFISNPMGIINVTQFKILRVSVLPSMRKGRLLSIYKKIPDTCPFQTWIELRRHWKNMYGYRLPETDDDIIYYEIYFPLVESNSGNHFIYPNICVREELNQFPYKNDPTVIMKKFINDLVGIMPKMCSRELQVNNNTLKNCTTIVPVQNESTAFPPQTPTKENEVQSDRLSLTNDHAYASNELQRQLTTSMSPTPSLLGKRINTTKSSFDFENLKKIKKIHESKPITIHQSWLPQKSQQPSMQTHEVPSVASTTSTFSKVPGEQTLVNMFSTSAESMENSNPQYRMPVPMMLTKPTVANRKNIPGLSHIK